MLQEKPGGYFVIQMNATDGDTGLNGRVRYCLRDPQLSDDVFFIDDVTGRVVTLKR